MRSTTVISLEAYYGGLAEDRREALMMIRQLIKTTWSGITEDMAYGIPTFHRNGQPMWAIASQKHFMALYVIPYDLLEAFKNDLKVHDKGKSCVRFKRLDPSMMDLFDRIIKYTGSQVHLSKRTARPTGTKKTLVRS